MRKPELIGQKLIGQSVQHGSIALLSSKKTKNAELPPLADYNEDESASIRDDSAEQPAPQLDGLTHPWRSFTEGGDKNYDILRRDQVREEALF